MQYKDLANEYPIISEYINQEMGNQPNKSNSSNNKKVVMSLNNQTIILFKELNMSLTIGQLQIFPHGLDGLKLWDAGIILSRYIILNCNKFAGRDVLELGAGVGISGLCVKKWTKAKSIMMTDYHPSVVENIHKNCEKNKEKDIINVVFDWREREKYQKDFDIIIGSDIVYFGCPVKDLYQVFKKFLRVGGSGIIVIPDRKNYAQLFRKEIQQQIFECQITKLTDQRYKEPVLQSVQESQKQYPLLKSLDFYIYELTRKKKQKKQDDIKKQ